MSSSEVFMREIAINCEGKPTIYFELNDDYIELNNLKRYFPNAVGLSYVKHGKAVRLNVSNNKLQLNPGVYEYEVVLFAGNCYMIIINFERLNVQILLKSLYNM